MNTLISTKKNKNKNTNNNNIADNETNENNNNNPPERRRKKSNRARLGKALNRLTNFTSVLSPISQRGGGTENAGFIPAAITVSSTLHTFGNSTFSLKNYIANVYVMDNSAAAASALPHHRTELQKRKTQLQQELQSSVTHQYHAFISMSREMRFLEANCASFSSLFSTLTSTMQSCKSHFQYSDDKRARRLREQEEELTMLSKRALEEEMALEEWNEDLRALIYERKYAEAIKVITASRAQLQSSAFTPKSSPHSLTSPSNAASKVSSSYATHLQWELNAHVHQLVETLLYELQSFSLTKAERRAIISYLITLGESEKARKIYLQLRSNAIKTALRTLRFQGDLTLYIQSLSSLYFLHIAATLQDFSKLFADRNLQSAAMMWAISELQNFGANFAKQTFASDSSLHLIGRCLRIAFSSAKSLETNGQSFSFLLANMVSPPLVNAVSSHYNHLQHLISERLESEPWTIAEVWVHDREKKKNVPADATSGPSHRKKALKLTPSAQYLYDCIRSLLKDLTPFLSASAFYPPFTFILYTPVVSGMIGLLEHYLLAMANAAKQNMSKFDDNQNLAILSNAFFLGDDLLPRIGREFRKQFGRAVPELENFGVKLGALYDALQDSYAQKQNADE